MIVHHILCPSCLRVADKIMVVQNVGGRSVIGTLYKHYNEVQIQTFKSRSKCLLKENDMIIGLIIFPCTILSRLAVATETILEGSHFDSS